MATTKAHRSLALKGKLIGELREAGVPEEKSFWQIKTASLLVMLFDKNPNASAISGVSKKDMQKLLVKAKREKAKEYRLQKYKQPASRSGFYDTDEWKSIRYKVLVKYGATCQCCGATRADGVKIHVDHIKPRSKHPELELSFENLQVLCEPCNMGKRARDQTDWRTL